jgi:hypothetical protein
MLLCYAIYTHDSTGLYTTRCKISLAYNDFIISNLLETRLIFEPHPGVVVFQVTQHRLREGREVPRFTHIWVCLLK